MASYTYRFIDANNNIIYVGKTSQTMDQRMCQHFGGKGHLPNQCYQSVARIEYKKWKTESDALIMETYYITKYGPRFNKLQQSRDVPSMMLDDKEDWKIYKEFKQVKPLKVQNTGWWRLVAIIYLIYMIFYYIFSK